VAEDLQADSPDLSSWRGLRLKCFTWNIFTALMRLFHVKHLKPLLLALVLVDHIGVDDGDQSRGADGDQGEEHARLGREEKA
jgi:hypothetical protein